MQLKCGSLKPTFWNLLIFHSKYYCSAYVKHSTSKFPFLYSDNYKSQLRVWKLFCHKENSFPYPTKWMTFVDCCYIYKTLKIWGNLSILELPDIVWLQIPLFWSATGFLNYEVENINHPFGGQRIGEGWIKFRLRRSASRTYKVFAQNAYVLVKRIILSQQIQVGKIIHSWKSLPIFLFNSQIYLPRSNSYFASISTENNMVCICGKTGQDTIWKTFWEWMDLDSVVWYCSNQSSILQIKQY